MLNSRKSGVLLHISSLPNKYMIGSLGKEAFDFVDLLEKLGMSYWQVLPLNATFSDPSPYSSISSIASNFYLIDIEKLLDYGLLDSEPTTMQNENLNKINYEKAIPYKKAILKKAYMRFKKMTYTSLYNEFLNYCADNEEWLNDYALFISIKEHYIYKRKLDASSKDFYEFNQFTAKYKDILSESKITDYYYGGAFLSWDDSLKFRNPETLERFSKLLDDRVNFYRFTQFIFNKQWNELHNYAKLKNIKIIGDLPIFVNYDSVDVWKEPHLFYTDENLLPSKVAGVPPDYFSKTGQLWGNPLYKWSIHSQDNYTWWKKRFENLYKFVDIVRIDHFRAFDSYWAIPITEKTAINGQWENGPGNDFFNSIFSWSRFPIIAEDLGLITESVTKLRKDFKLPGMFISHFHLLNYSTPDELKHLDENSVIYTGTHDNQTTISWLSELTTEEISHLAYLVGKESDDLSVDVYDIIRTCAETNINTFIVPLQDILKLDDNSRMNTPGTVQGNWMWRYSNDELNEDLFLKMAEINKNTNRFNNNNIY